MFDRSLIKVGKGFDQDAVVNAYIEISSNPIKLIINASADYLDAEQAYVAGFAEGYLTSGHIVNFSSNVLIDLDPSF